MAQGPGKLPNGILAKLAFEWRGSDVTSGADGKLFIAPYLTGSVKFSIPTARVKAGLYWPFRRRPHEDFEAALARMGSRRRQQILAELPPPGEGGWRPGEIPFATTPC